MIFKDNRGFYCCGENIAAVEEMKRDGSHFIDGYSHLIPHDNQPSEEPRGRYTKFISKAVQFLDRQTFGRLEGIFRSWSPWAI